MDLLHDYLPILERSLLLERRIALSVDSTETIYQYVEMDGRLIR